MATEYAPKQRLGRTFSDNVLVGNTEFPNAEVLAVSEGCPVKDMAIDHYGPEAAALRYGEIIFARQLILELAETHNPELFEQLIVNVTRESDEPVGNHEVGAVPESHLSVISSNNTPWGWSAPRLLTEMYGSRDKRSQKSFLQSLDAVQEVVIASTGPLELVARLAEKAMVFGVDKNTVLKRTVSAAYLDEEGTFKMYDELIGEVKKSAPTVWKEYSALTSEEKQVVGVALI